MMSTEQGTLTDFLLARIAEDERAARAQSRLGWMVQMPREAMYLYAPSRVLADCEAKRRIVEQAIAGGLGANPLATALNDWPLRLLAEVYADHPDYREEWKP